ncbi:hypothetical protein [Streptomyces apocyni]|uniref:hypothetical protein n=1 Tax=Streptomyces apocyni TaxID=2654677 RepID=UPI0012EA3433|nr:hypothetical protein [Streptomyces apocyni]
MKTLIAFGVCLVLLGGSGAWLLLSSETTASCSGLPENKRVQKSLGEAMQPGMSCAELGEAIVKATRGSEPARHSRREAQTLKDVLFSLGFEDSENLTVDPALRVPLATALADYAPDVHEMLAGLDPDYVSHADATDPPWEEGGTYHLAVYTTYFRDIVRAISQDPQAYAILRVAETRHAAQQLAAVPDDAAGVEFSLPAKKNARALGILDAIGVAIIQHRGKEEGQAWHTAVVDRILREPATERSYQDNPADYLIAAWLRELRNTPNTAHADRLATQGLGMARSWTTARNTDESARQDLLTEVERSESVAHQEIKS